MAETRRSLRLRTRLLLVAAAAVAVGLILNLVWAIRGFAHLEESSARILSSDLREVTREYLENYIRETSAAIADELAAAEADLSVVATLAQAAVLAPPPPPDAPLVADPAHRLERTPLGALQSIRGEWPATILYPYLLDARGAPRADVRREAARMAHLDPVMQAVVRHGRSRPLQIYHMGPKGAEVVRLMPWVDLSEVTERLYPTAHVVPWYERFFPGLVESWVANRTTSITYTAPYDDAAGGGLIISLFGVLWRGDAYAGAIGLDITLGHVARRISEIRLARTGFAFLVQENGNVVAAHDRALAELRLAAPRLEAAGVNILTRNLAESGDAQVVAIARQLPALGESHAAGVHIGGEEQILVLRRLRSVPVWSGSSIKPESWLLGFLVRKSELYSAIADARAAIDRSGRRIVIGQVVAALATLALVLAGILVLGRRLTAPLAALADGARELARRRYDVRVPESGDDEVTEVARAFNAMATQVREHTENLEHLVAERTLELGRSVDRLWAEMSLAHKIQTVLLPPPAAVRGYDIAAAMRPAETVGGDYYDFFEAGDSLWVLAGDVSDHGVSAGLIMMMAQTAVRTAAPGARGPAELLTLVNSAIHPNVAKIGLHQYMTICALRLDGPRVTHAGLHLDLLVWRAATGAVERIATRGVWLGLTEDIAGHLVDGAFDLAPGDLIVLYTDGLTEAPHEGGMFGIDRLVHLLGATAAAGKTAQAVVNELMAALPAGGFEDDVSVVAIRRAPVP